MRALSIPLFALLATACHGTLEFGSPDDDDSTSASDDDDATGDDDDDTTPADDDDDATPDWTDVYGYFQLVGTQLHPQGRASQGYGYFFYSEDFEGPAARGGDYGCTVNGANGVRGGDYVLLDAGDGVTFRRDGGEEWDYRLDRYEEGGRIVYWGSPDTGNPNTIPPNDWLDFEVDGGDDVPAFEMEDALPSAGPFPVQRPALLDGTEVIVLDPSAGVGFQWTAMNETGVALGAWVGETSVECWVEDNGAFFIEGTLMSQLSPGQGHLFIRRYTGQWAQGDGPPIYMQGAFQHVWTTVSGGSTEPGQP